MLTGDGSVASSRLRDDQAQLTKLGARLAIEQKEEARLVKQCDVFHSRIQALQEKILEVGGVKLRSQQSKVSDLRARIEHNLDRTTKAEVGLAKATKDVERLVKAIAANDHATASCQDELQDVDSRLKATLNDKNVIQSSVDQAQEVLAEKSEELLALKATLAEQEKGIALFKKRQVRTLSLSSRKGSSDPAFSLTLRSIYRLLSKRSKNRIRHCGIGPSSSRLSLGTILTGRLLLFVMTMTIDHFIPQ